MKYGIKKEAFREAAMRGLQKDQLFCPQIKDDGGQAGAVQILQNRAQAHETQGNQKVKCPIPNFKCQNIGNSLEIGGLKIENFGKR